MPLDPLLTEEQLLHFATVTLSGWKGSEAKGKDDDDHDCEEITEEEEGEGKEEDENQEQQQQELPSVSSSSSSSSSSSLLLLLLLSSSSSSSSSSLSRHQDCPPPRGSHDYDGYCYSGADIENICREAAFNALRSKRKFVVRCFLSYFLPLLIFFLSSVPFYSLVDRLIRD